MNIAILILNLNGKSLLEVFLPSVIKYSAGHDIYVVDNASSDNSIDYIKNNDDFKTRVFDYKIFSILNYTVNLEEQQELAEKLKKKIKNKLEI